MTKPKNLFEMSRQWVLPFVASWRTFEKTLNPAFYFVLRCGECGAFGSDFIKTIKSKKKGSAILGLQCTECQQTLKFEGLADPDADDFPQRLRNTPLSALSLNGEPIEDEPDLGLSDITRIMFDD